MRQPTVYIASSWKHAHAVELLTTQLRDKGFTVNSFVENNYGEGHGPEKEMPFEDWVETEQAQKAFEFDTRSAMESDLVVYIGPSGKDAAAELGMAYAKGVPIYGLWAKGEDFGLMRKLISKWFTRYQDLVWVVCEKFQEKEVQS